MSSVMAADACPSILWTAFTWAPDEIAREAAVCRRSWGVSSGKVGSIARARCTLSGDESRTQRQNRERAAQDAQFVRLGINRDGTH